MVLAGKDAVFVGEGRWDSWAELRFPSSLLPDVMLKLAADCHCVLCNFSQRFLGCFKANFANFVCTLLILIVTAILQPSSILVQAITFCRFKIPIAGSIEEVYSSFPS